MSDNHVLPTTSQERKDVPLVRGLLDYFPAALAEVAKLSRAGNEKHNPGEPLHHARGKSTDHADCIVRHLLDRGTIDDEDGLLHDVKVAWRALAMLQEKLEERGAPFARGAREPGEDLEDLTFKVGDPVYWYGAHEDRDYCKKHYAGIIVRVGPHDRVTVKFTSDYFRCAPTQGHPSKNIHRLPPNYGEPSLPLVADPDCPEDKVLLCPNYAGDRIAGDDEGTLARQLKNKYYHGGDDPEAAGAAAREKAFAEADVELEAYLPYAEREAYVP